MNINKLKDIYAIRMQGCSLVGIDTSSIPVSFGNYFSVLCSDGKCREIANMWYENFEHIVKKEKIKDENKNFEVGIKILDSKWALIHDKRFPNNYYTEDLSYRVPKKYWSITSLLNEQRHFDFPLELQDQPKKIKIGWTMSESVGIVVLNSSYDPKEIRERREKNKKEIKLILNKYDKYGNKL